MLFVPGFKDCITVKRCNFLNLSHCFLVYLVKLAGESDSTGLVPVQRSCASVVNKDTSSNSGDMLSTIFLLFPYFLL